jgi:uncharacterized protein (DUF58 family)
VTRGGSPRLFGYAALAAIGLVAALATRRPELAIVAAPFVLVLVLGLRLARNPRARVAVQVDAERTVEGADVTASLTPSAEAPVDRLEILLRLPPEVEVVDGGPARALRLSAGSEPEIPMTLRCSRWGVFDLGAIDLRARDPFRLVVWSARTPVHHRLKAYPSDVTLRRIVAPFETQVFAGSEVARIKGDGIEYADIRDFVAGDRVRSINWRASARRQALVVNERHPERNTDVVLFLDSFLDVRADGSSVLEQAVRATAALARRYLERRDRVGLVGLGGVLRWLQPGMGVAQRYRLVETMLETDVEPTYTWVDVTLIPARVLPPKALVLALTPLLDRRFVTALENLRARRFDVAVVEIDPVPLVSPGPGRAERLAHRMWILDRELQRSRLERAGIAVATWRSTARDETLDIALEEVRTFRRHARTARV